MRAVQLIERKRDGDVLSNHEIRWLIERYTQDEIPDYQMSALLMAVLFQGLNDEELAEWVEAMLASGDRLALSSVGRPRADKHSTGGVGDKVSIPLGPMVAACGLAVPMVSGRGLAHSGGTLDKLETIPGFNTTLDLSAIAAQVADIGLVFAGQSARLVPADRKLYALRDATGTVPSVPLIASSIMSKKLAENLDALVLDVKVGSGAFMKQPERARMLAETMVGIGKAHGVNTVALITDMNAPLGREVGNASEIAEAIALLQGNGPDDLTELTYALGAQMLTMTGIASDPADAHSRLQRAVDGGGALDTLARVIAAQGGNPAVIDNPALLPTARHTQDFEATQAGTITACDALQIGMAAMALGAGRATKEDRIDPAVGVTVLAKPGTKVEKRQPLARLAWNDERRRDEAVRLLDGAWTIGGPAYTAPALIKGQVG